jgi:hypothetical protein
MHPLWWIRACPRPPCRLALACTPWPGHFLRPSAAAAYWHLVDIARGTCLSVHFVDAASSRHIYDQRHGSVACAATVSCYADVAVNFQANNDIELNLSSSHL